MNLVETKYLGKIHTEPAGPTCQPQKLLSLVFLSEKDFVEIQPLCKEIGVTGRRPVLWDQVLGWWDAVGKVQGAH